MGPPAALRLSFARAHALSPTETADLSAEIGASGAIVDGDLEAGYVEALVPALLSAGVAVLGLEPGGRAQLCGPDREESRAAIEAAESTIARAAPFGARFVVLSLGEPTTLAREWQRARARYLRDQLDFEITRDLLDDRDDACARAFDVARRALDQLVRAAESAGITLLVREPRRYTALPSPQEMDALASDFAGAPVAPLFDLPAAHLQDDMGFHPLDLSIASFSSGPLHFGGDACGPVGALPPGRGTLPLTSIYGKLPKDSARAIDPWRGLTLSELRSITGR
jgi:hypothetical protein